MTDKVQFANGVMVFAHDFGQRTYAQDEKVSIDNSISENTQGNVTQQSVVNEQVAPIQTVPDSVAAVNPVKSAPVQTVKETVVTEQAATVAAK